MIPEALDNIQNGLHDNYSQLMNLISTKQKMVLIAIAKEGIAKQITSAAFLKAHYLPSSSAVQSAIKGLLEKDLVIRQDDGSYTVYDYSLGSGWQENNVQTNTLGHFAKRIRAREPTH